MAKTIIAYDLGTGGAKASLYAADGSCLASTFMPYETIYPNAGWHEQRPSDWWNAIVSSTRALMKQKHGSPSDVDCLAISGQSLAVIPLDSSGNLLRDSIPIWSDTRASRQTAEFFGTVDRDRWYMTTGNGFPAECYSVFKIMWYRDNEPGLFSRTATVLGSKDYINLRLTGKALTDYSYASGTGIYDLLGWRYSDEFIRASGLPASLFPMIVPSTEIIGTLTDAAAHDLGLSPGVKVACGGVDNSCMALGARNTGEGRVYTSLGSSSWIAVSSSKPVLDPTMKPYVFTHVIPGLFTSAVSVFAGGSSFRWIRDALFGGGAAPDGRDAYDVMNELAAGSPIGAHALLFNPSLAGGSSQEPSPHIRGAFAGIDLRHTRGDLVHLFEPVPKPGPNGRHGGGPQRACLLVDVGLHAVHAVDVGENLPPQGALASPADHEHLGGKRHEAAQHFQHGPEIHRDAFPKYTLLSLPFSLKYPIRYGPWTLGRFPHILVSVLSVMRWFP